MPEPQFDEIDIRGIFGLLRRQMRLILIATSIVLGCAAIASFTLQPVFTATALVLVDPSTKNLLNTPQSDPNNLAASARIDSEVEIIKSHSTLLGVVNGNGLISDEEFGVKLSTGDRILTWLRLSEGRLPIGDQALNSVLGHVSNSLKVRRRGLTYLIAVSFSAATPTKAADLANAVTDSYIHNQLTEKVRGALAIRDILNARIAEAANAISLSEEALGDYVFANIDRISAQTGNAELAGLTSQLSGFEATQRSIDELSSMIENTIQAQNWSALSARLGSDEVSVLEQERLTLIDTIEHGPSDPEPGVNLHAELSAIEKQMSVQAKKELARLGQSTLELQSKSVNLKSEIRISAISTDLPADMMTEIFELQQNAGEARTQYQTLLSRLREIETQVDLQIADSRVVAAALPPANASFPNKPLILASALALGLGLGICLAFFNEFFVGGFTSHAQLENILKVPVLAAVPIFRGKAEDGDFSPTEAMFRAPLSRYAENIRRILADIDHALQDMKKEQPGSNGSTIMVCSAAPGEGKTTIALSLARAYAISGQKTLLIDADLRRPSVQKELGGSERPHGLLEILSQPDNSKLLKSAGRKDEHTELHILLGTTASNVPTDQLFASRRFVQILEAAKKSYDIIIFDTPPIGPVVDAQYLAQYIDYLLLVTKWASTAQNDVKTALTRLSGALPVHAHSGVVLNQQDMKLSGYFSNYKEYYDEG